ncbi:hypothetical protein OM428_07535 [Enterococcus gallinarum]|nr:hypothetical protein [Enterococcus gallinarum]
MNANYPGNPGAFVNGFFDSEPIQYGEWAYGYAKEHQTICKLPNLRGLSLSIGQEQSSDSVWQTEQIQLTLDMAEGILHESYHVETPLGKSFDLEMQSFASMTRSEFYVCRYTIKNANFTEPITVSHPLDQRFTVNQTDDPRVANKEHQLLKEEHGDYAIWTAPHSQKNWRFG